MGIGGGKKIQKLYLKVIAFFVLFFIFLVPPYLYFPTRAGKDDFRMWSSQFFKYAGFKRADGSVIGDKANVEFTEVGFAASRLLLKINTSNHFFLLQLS